MGYSTMEGTRSISSVYRNEPLCILKCQQWFGQIRSGNISFDDCFRSFQQISVNTEFLKTVIVENPKQTARELERQVSKSLIRLGKPSWSRKVSKLGQWVTYHLVASQFNQSVILCHWRVDLFPSLSWVEAPEVTKCVLSIMLSNKKSKDNPSSSWDYTWNSYGQFLLGYEDDYHETVKKKEKKKLESLNGEILSVGSIA